MLGSQQAAGRWGLGKEDSREVKSRKSVVHLSAGTAWPAHLVSHTTRTLPVLCPGDWVRSQYPEPGGRAGQGLGPAVGAPSHPSTAMPVSEAEPSVH